MTKLYLIDGNAYIHRAYHAVPPLTNPKGEMVNAVFGFARMLLKVIKEHKPQDLIVCFDYPAKNFRHEEFKEYKANRKEIDDDLKTQMPMAREFLTAFGIAQIELEGFEADDLIGTLARKAENEKAEVVVVSGDKDILQLVNENIKVYNEQKGVLYDAEKVFEKYGLKPEQLVDMFALMGDASDNVSGVEGIGEKTAVKLIAKYGSVESVLEHSSEIPGKIGETLSKSKEVAMQSKFLVTLHYDAPIELDWQKAKLPEINSENSIKYLKEMGFASLIAEISQDHKAAEPQIPPVTFNSKEAVAPRLLNIESNTVLLESQLKKLVTQIENTGFVSLDVETDGLDALNANLVGISLSVEEGSGYYIPIGHRYLGAPQQLSKEVVTELLGPVLINKRIKKYGHNLKFDILSLNNYGLKVFGPCFDSMIASYCLDPSKPSHGLKELSLNELGHTMTHISELIGKGKNQITMDMVEVERVAPYASQDAAITLNLAKKYENELIEKKVDKLFYDLEMPLVPILCQMEQAGIKIDVRYLELLSKEFELYLQNIEAEVFKLAGQEFNLNSPKQLAFVLFEKLGLPVIRKTKTGNSTDEEVLKALSASHELPAKLLEFRELQKLRSTYIESLLNLVDKGSKRVHTSFNQAVTATGRLSSSEPNLQNIPIKSEYGRKIRKAFISEPNTVLVSADYSQIDLRSLAHISQDEALVKAFKEGGDIHSLTAKEMFGEANSDTRRIAKTINFGVIYGQSAYALALQLGITNSKAKEFIDGYFMRYKGVKEWLGQIIKFAKHNGYVTTLLGRVRYLPDINAKNAQLRGFSERMAMNTPIQGTSADIIKAAMIKADIKIKEKGLTARMLLQVHDELVFEVEENELQTFQKMIKSEMESAVALTVPLIVDIKTGKNWMEMTKQKI